MLLVLILHVCVALALHKGALHMLPAIQVCGLSFAPMQLVAHTIALLTHHSLPAPCFPLFNPPVHVMPAVPHTHTPARTSALLHSSSATAPHLQWAVLVDRGFWLADVFVGTFLLCLVSILCLGGLLAKLQSVLMFSVRYAQ